MTFISRKKIFSYNTRTKSYKEDLKRGGSKIRISSFFRAMYFLEIMAQSNITAEKGCDSHSVISPSLPMYPIGLIASMTGPNHRANLIPSTGSHGRGISPLQEEEEEKVTEAGLPAGDARSVKMLIRGTPRKGGDRGEERCNLEAA